MFRGPDASTQRGGYNSVLPGHSGFVTFLPMRSGSLLATRRSLVDRLGNWDDQRRWQEFFDTYWKLIYAAAKKAGLTDVEAQEVVQETVITVAKNIGKLRYDPAIGSFKGWLLNITRWRIADQYRKRLPDEQHQRRQGEDRMTATMDRFVDPRAEPIDQLWEQEWKQNLLDAAITRLKKKIDPKQFQIFDCSVRKEWPGQKVAERRRGSAGQVYPPRPRGAALLKKEIKALQKTQW